MATYVVDIETDGLVSTKIHVMSVGYKDGDEWVIKSTPDYDHMKAVMEDPDNVIVGHNFKMFDAVELERVLDFKINARVIDTLALAWYIFPNRTRGTFGLEKFGKDYGVEKPKIDDWEGLNYEDYEHRCEADVTINIKLWEDIVERLVELYEDPYAADSFIKYLMFKMDCMVEQQGIKCKIDLDKVQENIDKLTPILEEKEDALIEAMPPGNVSKSAPKKMYKKDGSISSLGQKWFDLLDELKLPPNTEEVREDANPASTSQLKDWLFELGWEPDLFNDGANGPVPQVRDKNKQLCESVLKLAEKEPAIHHLDGYTVINHRLAILKAFQEEADEDGYVVASMAGFTNTLRVRHAKPIVNLPGVTGTGDLRDGQIIRECIVAPEGYVLCGSDITSLEDNTKRHYMWNYDPEYVTEQMQEGFDPHLDLAVRAGAITQEQATAHTEGKEDYKPIRDLYKMANYSCIYGVGAPKLAKTTGLKVREAKKLIDAYWDRNWSIKYLPKDIKTKVVRDSMWLLNPVSKFWYSLRNDKDIFSTLNQGTGAFVFDLWVKFMMMEGVTPFLQYHDEKLSLTKTGEEEKTEEIVKKAMEKVNDLLELNVEITVDVKFGGNYAEVH